MTVYYLDEFTYNCGCYQDAASIVIVLTWFVVNAFYDCIIIIMLFSCYSETLKVN